MITASIDVTQLDKSFFRRVKRASGQEAVFLDIVLFPTPHAKQGGWMIKQDIGKEAREAGLVRPIIGNAVDPSTLNVNKSEQNWE